jgi:hypothetical protein
MSECNTKTRLEFDRWLALGVVTAEQVEEYAATFETSDDKNPEHYRYGAFRAYLSAHRPLEAPMARTLYELGNTDPDTWGMGGAMMADIVGLPECPPDVVEAAAQSGRKYLVKLADTVMKRRDKDST